MKNLLKLIAFIFLLSSCKVSERNQLVFDIGKSITISSLEKIYKVKINIKKDSLFLLGTFPKIETKQILGIEVSKAFTRNGKILVDNENFFAVLEYYTPHQDSTTILTQYYKK